MFKHKSKPEEKVGKASPQKSRKVPRHNVAYYLPVYDNDKGEILGHLVDISASGMMIDCKWNIPTTQHYNLRLELMDNNADKAAVEFVACCKWCRQDKIQAYIWNAGFEIVNIAEEDLEILKDIGEKYEHHDKPNPFSAPNPFA